MNLRHFVSPLALAASLAAASASAQTAPQASDQTNPTTLQSPTLERAQIIEGEAPTADTTQGDDITVTGTRLSRPNLKSATPILTITSAEIKAQGAINLEEVTNRLGQVQPDAQQEYQQSNGQQRGVKLRGLDFNRFRSKASYRKSI